MSTHWCSSKFKAWGLTVLAIMASTVLFSCTMPHDGMPTSITYWALKVVSADGSAHWTISDGGTGPLLTDSAVVFVKGNGLFKVKYDGSNLTQLHQGPRWGYHSLSLNGKKVLLSSDLFEKSGYVIELYLMNPDGTNLVKLAPAKGLYIWPRISPYLDEIAFLRDGSIATINTDGTNFQYVRMKTDSTSCMFSLYVDQTHILYTESVTSGSSISLRLFDKTNRQDKLVGVYSPGSFPLYGKAVVGSGFLLAASDGIKIFNVYTSTFRTVGQGWYASFSSDGSQIVGSKGKNIFTMNSDGSNVQTIYTEMDSTKGIINPQFSPDDRYVVFQSLWTSILR